MIADTLHDGATFRFVLFFQVLPHLLFLQLPTVRNHYQRDSLQHGIVHGTVEHDFEGCHDAFDLA